MLVALLVASSGLVFAQETTGTISGRVLDSQNLAVPGAVIIVTGPQGEKRVVSDADGRYSAPFLTPGLYDIRAELEGFKTVERKGVAVGLGQSLDVPLRMEVGGLTETVQVMGSVDIVNTGSTTTGANLSSDLLMRVPVGRDIGSALYLAPGVSSSVPPAPRIRRLPAAAASTINVIDGVNVTNQGYGALGSYSIVFGSLGNATPFDFMQEIQIKTGGYEAEFGQSTGGVVNVITKSGSNDIRGSLFGYSRPDMLESNWTQFQSTNGSVQTAGTHTSDAGIEGGFPIIRNKLFFFGAIDPGHDVRTLNAPEGFPLQSLGDVDRVRNTMTYSTKGTWQPSPSHRFDVSFFGEPSKGDNGPQRLSSLLGQDTSSFSSVDYGGHNQTVRYNGILGPRWLIEGTFARALNSITETPSVDTWRVTDKTVTPNIVNGGIGFYEAGNRGVNYQWAAKSTNIVGPHEFRYGFEYDDVSYSQINNRTGPTFTAPDGRQTATGAEIQIIPDPAFGEIYASRARTSTPADRRPRSSELLRAGQLAGHQPPDGDAGLRYEQEN
jgi:hypothetical protein